MERFVHVLDSSFGIFGWILNVFKNRFHVSQQYVARMQEPLRAAARASTRQQTPLASAFCV